MPSRMSLGKDDSPVVWDQDVRREDGLACREWALKYLQMFGWAALPLCPPDHLGVGRKHGRTCTNPGKVPLIYWTQYQTNLPTLGDIALWWREHPTANVGTTLGPASGVLRVDVEGPAGEARLLNVSRGDLPPTPEFTSGRDNGGRGLLYAMPRGVELRTTYEPLRVGEELRLQAQGAQTVLPPSRHFTGRLYRWQPGRSPENLKPAPAPAWLVAMLRADRAKEGARRPARVLGDDEQILEGQRDALLTSLAGTMRRRGMVEEEIAAALLVVNSRRCVPPLPEDVVWQKAKSVCRYAPKDALVMVRVISRDGGSHHNEYIRFEVEV